jgi:hypothetical protein
VKYFIAAIQYSEPNPEKDTIKKVRKKVLVRAESVTEVEIKCQGWFVANWQDPIVKSVTETPIQEVHTQGDSEAYWSVKVMFEDTDSGKWTPHVVAANGGTIEIVLPRVKKLHSMGEIEEIKKLKIEFDTDLLN